jgi:hypothetical protein
MKHTNQVLCSLLDKIVELYFEAVFPTERPNKSKIDPSMFLIDQWTTAGAYIELRRRLEFKIPGQEAARLWSGIWFDLNDQLVPVAIVVYVENGYLKTIEIAAAGMELPEIITSFQLST